MDESRLRISVCLMAVLLGCPAVVFAEGACTCDDYFEIERRLAEKQKLLQIASQVFEEAVAKWFPTAGWSKARFLQLAFPDGKYRVDGVQNFGEEPQVSEEQKRNCDGIWKATQAHEEDHAQFDKAIPNNIYLLMTASGREGRFLAQKEMMGYMAEVEYLEFVLRELDKKCGHPPALPAMERYGEQERFARESQKQRVEGAATRVGAYAASLT